MKTRFFGVSGVLILGMLLASAPASASLFLLDFEGLADSEPIQDFYNGGLGGFGSGPGANYGVTFSSNSLGLIDFDAGGTGNFGGEPSPSTVMYFLNGQAATMNVLGGFNTGFSFWYSAINNPGFVTVYDGLNQSGNILANLNLPLTPYAGAPDPTGEYSPFVPIGVAFTGTAMSVDFGGAVNHIGFDNVTFGSETPGAGGVPEPATIGLLSIGLAGLAARRRRANNKKG